MDRVVRTATVHWFAETLKGDAIMKIEAHLETLERKHGALEEELADALAHPSVDDLEIADLKRRKLLLKDAMEKLRADVTTH